MSLSLGLYLADVSVFITFSVLRVRYHNKYIIYVKRKSIPDCMYQPTKWSKH